MCGLRSAPREWQDHFASVLKELMVLLMAYVDDIMVFGASGSQEKRFKAMQDHVLLKQTVSLDEDGPTPTFLGRNLLRESNAIL